MKRSAWPVALPPMLGGVLLAHALAFRLTVPEPQRDSTLAATGHAWFAYLPALLAGAAALLLLGLVQRVVDRNESRPSAWPFALFPPLALFLQEQLERGAPALDATIVAGVLLAVPLGLAAYAVLRALLRVADSLAAWSQPARVALPSLVVPQPDSPATARVLAAPVARGPPRSSS